MSEILQAARSYYGLADADVRKTEIYTNESGQPMLVFEIAFGLDDYLGIASRMKAMREPEQINEPVQQNEGVQGRKVAHIDAPIEEEDNPFSYLWIPESLATDVQKQFAADYIKGKGYMIPWPMLTDEQKNAAPKYDLGAKYMPQDRLTGADGKPTSNAGDFGGMPG